ncbi:MAG: ADP-ribosylglycohydrolase family protein [Clostridiaceae bacterium]
MKRNMEFFRGCLLGGAIGDALGWPVEFSRYSHIINKYGEKGIRDLVYSRSGKVEITDDTQMTLFTAEGILRSQTMIHEKGVCDESQVVYNAYQRWMNTQGYPRIKDQNKIYDGWLLGVKDLHMRRGPGMSCLSALLSEKQGTINEPINNSKGCGGVMRAAPVGLFYPKEKAFERAASFAALTHGHPSGYLSAGALAYIIASIIEGRDLEWAVKDSLSKLSGYNKNEECCGILQEALNLYNSNVEPLDAINRLGEGWVGEEALGISVFCALKFQDDFEQALITAVNHDGDSDSTGAITGNILGAYLGVKKIRPEWIEKVELKDVLIQIADDLLVGYQEDQEWRERYPGC